jgi:DNA-binding winged helix-turn-helix (wHTH) protein
VATTRGFDGKQRLVLAAVTVVFLTVLAVILAVQGYRALLEETFRERGIAYTQVFAASAGAWIEPLNTEMLQAAARFLLVGSALFVRIEVDGDLVIDERGEKATSLDLPSAPSGGSPVAETLRLASGRVVLDVTVPLLVLGEPAGFVRMGIDTVSIVARSRITALAAAGIAVAVDALILGLLLWSHRGRIQHRLEGSASAGRAADSEAEAIAVGDLRIDPAIKRVTLRGERVNLTPKQFALIEFLARQRDRVVSEKEIVEEVWPESHYADSKDVKQYVYLVRKRLAKVHPTGPDLIVTVPGFGYRLVSGGIDEDLTAR